MPKFNPLPKLEVGYGWTRLFLRSKRDKPSYLLSWLTKRAEFWMYYATSDSLSIALRRAYFRQFGHNWIFTQSHPYSKIQNVPSIETYRTNSVGIRVEQWSKWSSWIKSELRWAPPPFPAFHRLIVCTAINEYCMMIFHEQWWGYR